MARKLKPTPTLKGKDAIRFNKRMREVDDGKHRISKEEYERMLANFNSVKIIEN